MRSIFWTRAFSSGPNSVTSRDSCFSTGSPKVLTLKRCPYDSCDSVTRPSSIKPFGVNIYQEIHTRAGKGTTQLLHHFIHYEPVSYTHLRAHETKANLV